MQQKLVMLWGGGSVEVAKNGVILIRQGKNVIEVVPDEIDAFLTDVQNAPTPKPLPTPVAGGGGMFPLKPNPQSPKSIQTLVDELENIVQPHI
jgi:hypothetical protein